MSRERHKQHTLAMVTIATAVSKERQEKLAADSDGEKGCSRRRRR